MNTLIRRFEKHKKTNERKLKLFVNKLAQYSKTKTDQLFQEKDQAVWQEVVCLDCSRCCRKMTPTYTPQDMKRIATHFKMSVRDFQEKWLYKERGQKGDWRNKNWPCQFLDLKTNFCTIYDIRPHDCASFPHHHKKPLIDYSPMLKQNISHCPATNLLLSKVYDAVHQEPHILGQKITT